MKRIMIAAIAAALLAGPAQSQSLAEQARDLKNSFNQLIGRKSPAPAATSATTTAGTTQDVDQDEMITEAAMADDTSNTTLSSLPVSKGNVSTFDILGLKLGMSPREVARIAKPQRIKAKYKTANPGTGDFDFEATMIANRQLSRPLRDRSKKMVSKAWGVTREGSQIDLDFTLTPEGPRLSSIIYNTRMNGQTDAQLRDALLARYGKWDQETGYQQQWCGGAGCGSASDRSDTLRVYHSDGKVVMTLLRSSNYRKAAEAALNARAAQIAARTGGKTNF